jgi:hypothetical protein
MVARPDNTAGLPEMHPNTPYVLQMASREILPILKEALEKLILGLSAVNLGVYYQYH